MSEKPPNDKPAGDKPAGDKPTGEKPAGDKPAGEKLKPVVFTPEQVAEQISALQIQKDQITITVVQLRHQLQKIQTAIKENDDLRVRIKKTMNDSYSYFAEEWKRKTDFFPEIRLQVILKAADSLAPKK